MTGRRYGCLCTTVTAPSAGPPERCGEAVKVESLAHAVAPHYMHYSFACIHKTLRITPAMAAGVTSRLWSIEDIVRLADGHLPGNRVTTNAPLDPANEDTP